MNSKTVPLDHLDDEELTERLKALALNLCYIDRVLTIPPDVVGVFKETAEECDRRGLHRAFDISPHLHEDDPLPNVHKCGLVRYGRREHLEALMRGRVSFGPASLYRDATIGAQRDDEMRRPFRATNRTLRIGGIDYPATKITLFSTMSAPDGAPLRYHLFSTSIEESLKLGRAFQADGYVTIRNCRLFFELLDRSLKRICASATLRSKRVRYYDDLCGLGSKCAEDHVFSKTIHYLYQREVRTVIIGAPGTDERFEVEIDPPDDLFELRLLGT